MSERKKRFFFLNHKKSSALVVSVVIHIVFIVVALTFVAVQVYVKPEQTFEATDVKRPKMKLKKLQVPVKEKKVQAPKLRHTIVTKPKYKDVNIQMPEIIGVPGGTGYGKGDGLGGLGFNFDLDLFGGSRGSGNELIGTFYDLKQEPDGDLTDIGKAVQDKNKNHAKEALYKVIKGFVGSGFNEGRLNGYFKGPKLKYATALMMPPIDANAAPEAFGVEDQVKPSYWVCHYKGQIAAPESGRYRFCGLGDDVLFVRVGRRMVLDACWAEHIKLMSDWLSKSDQNRLFPLDRALIDGINFKDIYSQIEDLGGWNGSRQFYEAIKDIRVNGEPFAVDSWKLACRMVYGDWFTLRKGQAVDIDILIGEIPGGSFMCRLMIEQEGKHYKMVPSDAGPRPVLPVFKTTEIDEKLAGQMKIDSNHATLDGPVFGVGINGKKKALGAF